MKLFHCIVVMGAAMGSGCGANDEGPPSSSPDAHSDDPSTPATTGAGCPAEAGPFHSPFGCFSLPDPCGSMQYPRSPNDCPSPQQLDCADPAGCRCDLTAPLSPADCPIATQFNCATWNPSCGCECHADAALDPTACGCEGGASIDASAVCPNGLWECHSYDPPVGCECRISIPIL